jgi:hypothetical protein
MRRITIVLATVVALAAAGLALAQIEVEDRISLKATGGNVLEHYSPALAIVAVSPPAYTRVCCNDSNGGEWTGVGGLSSILWSVGVSVQEGGTRAGLIANLTHDWPVVSEGKQLVKHRVGGRAAGTIAGYWILTRSPVGGADDARMEAAVGVSLCDGNTAYTTFSLLIPSGNSTGPISGMSPSDWNTEKAMQSIRGIRFEGNRPGRRVTATARGRRVSGRVLDCSAHPLAAVPVELQRRTGSSWQRVSSGRTNAAGSYSLAVRSAGTYRARAATRTSAPVRVR